MAKEVPEHSKLLTAAARTILRPIGMIQKGRSRIWLADHGWWVCVVEFQPSSWSRGSYLNVGCMWLWSEKNYISFDEGNRVAPFNEFKNHDRFEAVALGLAQQAADEVQNYRSLFPNPERVGKFYLSSAELISGWTSFHAGIACALSGKAEEAFYFFDEFLKPNANPPSWLVIAQADAKKLKSAAGNLAVFRSIVADRIHRARTLQKLPPLRSLNL